MTDSQTCAIGPLRPHHFGISVPDLNLRTNGNKPMCFEVPMCQGPCLRCAPRWPRSPS